MPQAETNGKPATDVLEIALQDQSGEFRKIADFRGRNVIVYFYPMDDTPGCTVEAKEFRNSYEQFEELGCLILGVSTDSVARHRAFADKHAFPFLLLADEGGRLAEAFGVLKGARAARTTFVFDRDLRMRKEFRDVTPKGHAAQVLNFVRSMVESHRMLGG
jgi:peroxiredoxin Q/BCP